MSPEQMEIRIRESFPDCDVVVMDTTGTGDHFDVRVASSAFAGLTRIAQHKAVMALFSAELQSGEVHALAIKTMTKSGEKQ